MQAPVGITLPNQTLAAIPPTAVPNILNTLNQALVQVQQAAGITDPKKLDGSKTEANNPGTNTGNPTPTGGLVCRLGAFDSPSSFTTIHIFQK